MELNTSPPKWTTALPDWERRIIAGESIVPVKPLYPVMANRAVAFMERLRLRDVLGQPTIGEVTRDWVYDFAGAMFGAQNPTTYRRDINDFFLLIAKKNTKSTIAAAMMMTAIELDDRESSEYLILAPTKEVADNSFIPCRDMITLDPYLSATYHVQQHTRTITNTVTGATLKVVAADDKTVGGKKATGVLIDELHLFGKVAGAESMIAEATGGLLSRIDGFVIKLSTQSTEPPAGVFKAELDLARDVRDGKIINPQYMPVLYEFPKAMLESKAYENPENFYITNPNLGASVDTQTLTGMLAKAKSKGGEALMEFYAKHLNVEVGMNLRNDRWAGTDFWDENGNRPEIDLDWMLEHCEVIDIGVDGGGLDDLLGISVVGRLKDNPRIWAAWFHAWAHPSVLERRKEIAPVLLDFAKQGDLTIVHRIGDDSDEVAGLVARVYQSGLLDKCGLDPHGVGAILDAMLEYGVPEDAVVGVSQGWKLGAAIKTAERKLAEGCFIHNGSAMMNWVVGNARVEPRANGILITKQASGSAKIDPLMAMFDAVSLLSLNPVAKGSVDDFLNDIIIA